MEPGASHGELAHRGHDREGAEGGADAAEEFRRFGAGGFGGLARGLLERDLGHYGGG